ncbi:hypothetical protein, partial [Xenorhabdus bovienii]|uniref:hypothetical protein n=1 Tax=Xenorhabdus bovienii TaxID=40576 RepID=UPI00237C9B52
CKKAGYKAATYLSELAQWKPLQTGRVHINTMYVKSSGEVSLVSILLRRAISIKTSLRLSLEGEVIGFGAFNILSKKLFIPAAFKVFCIELIPLSKLPSSLYQKAS